MLTNECGPHCGIKDGYEGHCEHCHHPFNVLVSSTVDTDCGCYYIDGKQILVCQDHLKESHGKFDCGCHYIDDKQIMVCQDHLKDL